MSTPAGDDLVGNARIRVDGDTDPALRALGRFSRDADGRLRDLRGRFVSESALITRSLTGAAGGSNRFSLSLRGLSGIASSAAGVLGKIGPTLAKATAAAGSAAPLLAGIVATLQNVAPAGAAAATGMLAIQQASAAVKLGMVGISDAASAAFDTSAAGTKKFDEALKKLAPNARSFALALRGLQPEFKALQQGVQDRLFAGFGEELTRLGEQVLPTVRTNLNSTALTLNRMAIGASNAARELAVNGTLGKAMAGANQGLLNLRTVPGLAVTALGQLAAAGSLTFDRLTAGAVGVAHDVSERLTEAFESGALEKSVNAAVDVLKDLGTVASNIFGTLSNVMAPVQEQGGGLVGMLVQITGALKEVSGTQAFQSAIGSLAGVMGTLAQTVGPLLGQALTAIAPVFTALGPPVEQLITSLGSALGPVITGLGPVLAAAAGAVGLLIEGLSPILPIIGDLIGSLLPPLVPLLNTIADVFVQAAPVVQILVVALANALAPILAQLPTLVRPITLILSNLAGTVFPLLADVITALAPSLAEIGGSFANLLVAATPLILVITQLVTKALAALLPSLPPIISGIARLASILAGTLTSAISNIVIPVLNTVTALLRGDFSAAWRSLGTLFDGVGRHIGLVMTNIRTVIGAIVGKIVEVFRDLYNTLIGNSIIPDLVNGIRSWFGRLPGMVFRALASLASGLVRIATSAMSRFRSAVVAGGTAAVNWARGLPGRIRSAIASLGGILATQARNALSRFTGAIRSGASTAVSAARGIPGRIRSALGNLGGYLTGAGRALVRGFISGIRSMVGAAKDAASDVVGAVRRLFPGSPAKEGPFSGKGWTLYSGRAVGESLAAGISQRAALAARSARGLVESVAATTNGLSGIAAPSMAAAASAPTRFLAQGVPRGPALGVGSMRTAGTGTTTIVNNHNTFENHGVIGSRLELRNWLAAAVDDLNRRSRLPKPRAA